LNANADARTDHKKAASLGGWLTAVIVALAVIVVGFLLLALREQTKAGRYQARRGRS
jgi:hypothetical protein